MLLWTADAGLAQSPPEVRRARPIDEPPVARALPLEEPPAPVPRRSAEEPSEPAAQDTEVPDRRQLDYANALGMSADGSAVFVTGTSSYDYATIAYAASTGLTLSEIASRAFLAVLHRGGGRG